MLTYQLRERIFNVVGGGQLEFPNTAEIEISLQPGVPFGVGAGLARHAIPGVATTARANFATGRIGIEIPAGALQPLKIAMDVGDTHFEMNGNVVHVTALVSDLQDLTDLMGAVYFGFVGVLNVYYPDAPSPEYAVGRIGQTRFRWEYAQPAGGVIVTSQENQEETVRQSWSTVVLFAGQSNRRLIAALQYFHIGCRLLTVGRTPWEFLSEALLNLAKVIDSLFGPSRECQRAELRKVGFSDQEIESKLIPIMVVRNEFDVAHVSLASLSSDQLALLHDVAASAEAGCRDLLKRVIAKVKEATYALPPDPDLRLEKKKLKVLGRLMATRSKSQ